jgi:hypothetical protein
MRADEMNIIFLPPLLLRFKRQLLVISSRRGDDTAPPQPMVSGLFSVSARVFVLWLLLAKAKEPAFFLKGGARKAKHPNRISSIF